MLAESIKKPLTDELVRQFDYYDFEVTAPAKEFIEAIVDAVVRLIDQADEDELLDESYYSESDALQYVESYLDDTDCYKIIRKALKHDPSHFVDILDGYSDSMTGSDCLGAEWTYNILPDILTFIIEFIENSKE